MIILSFVEGAARRKGGIGLPVVPIMLRRLAARGHNVVLVVVGDCQPCSEKFVVRDIRAALQQREGVGTFGIVKVAAWTSWAFNPSLLWLFRGVLPKTSVILAHSLYSFPVLVSYLLARIYNKPQVIWLHGVLAPVQRRISRKRKWIYDKLLGRNILNCASALVFTAQGEREETRELRLTAPSVVVPHGFDSDEFAALPPRGRFRARFLGGYDGCLVVFLARLNAKKGLDVLIKAMARVIEQRPDVRLAIVGPPDPPSFGGQVTKWIRQSGIGASVILAGPVGPEARLEVFADADIYVLPSQAENFGFSVFEAMACRVPVVIGEALNYAGEISSSGAGLAVRPDPETVATAVLCLVANPGLRNDMGEQGARLARRYTWEANSSRVERLLEVCIQHQSLPVDLAQAPE